MMSSRLVYTALYKDMHVCVPERAAFHRINISRLLLGGPDPWVQNKPLWSQAAGCTLAGEGPAKRS